MDRPTNDIKVLLIEDEVYVIERVKKMLEKYNNITLNVSSDYKTAKENLMNNSWDIVISTTFLYGISVLEINHLAREKNKDVCVIITTGLSTITLAERAVKEGAFAVVLKPAELDKIDSFVKLYLVSRK